MAHEENQDRGTYGTETIPMQDLEENVQSLYTGRQKETGIL